MHKKQIPIFILLILLSSTLSLAIDEPRAEIFGGQDLHLVGAKLTNYQLSSGQHILVFDQGFSVSVGANKFSAGSGVAWLETVTTESRGRVRRDVRARIYLSGIEKELVADKTVALKLATVEGGESAVLEIDVSGEVLVTADERMVADPRQSQFYQRALIASELVDFGPKFFVKPQAMVPQWPPVKTPAPTKEVAVKKPEKKSFISRLMPQRKKAVKKLPPAVEPEEKEPQFSYPVNIAGIGEVAPKIEWDEKTNTGTIIGRLYLWQKQNESGRILELQADNAVVFRSGQKTAPKGSQDVLIKGDLRAVYLTGDVLMTEGQRTIRADEMYYDFHNKKALVVNAVMRNFDTSRGVPIYVRAEKLRQVAENKFTAEDITITSSEFYKPQISTTASDVIITDTTTIDAQPGEGSYDVEMRDIRMKVGNRTFFRWPKLRSNMSNPDVPIKSLHVGNDSIWGTSLETRWYLSRLLGLKEPEGVESTLALDYFSDRGIGVGAEIEYEKEDYYGKIQSYLISDRGEDRLGREEDRKNLKPDRKLRGRFSWMHRQFLPYNWQLTTGVDYLSDENFLEGYYRGEFYSGRDEETYVHLKRAEDNWALAFLGKSRINDFTEELESLPTAEYHLIGQSLFEDKLTLYSDSYLSRGRQRTGETHSIAVDEDWFTFASHRTELDMPLRSGPFKLVPFVAGTFGYDDRSGFRRSLVDGSNTGTFGEDKAWIGEAGIRIGTQYSKVFPNVKSRLWDLNKLRHVVRPQIFAVHFQESDNIVDQRDIFSIGLSQKLQTKRTTSDEQRNVDWMRLDVDFTWVDGSGDAKSGPDEYIWNNPMIPLNVFSTPDIFNGDLATGLQRFENWGPRRNYFSADYIWRLSDTTAILSDMNFDMQSSVVQQFNVGFSRLAWPNLSYYIGSRYLRRTDILNEKGSNTFTFAATYVLDPRYTLVFGQQFDFDYGASIRSDITIIRKYHRLCYGLTLSSDASLDRDAIVFSIWPQGISELAIGPRRYTGLGTTAGY